jgi:very-short-patch-repair endonuclease
MSEFTQNLDELLHLSSQKVHLVRHLTKNYKENIHYIIEGNKIAIIKNNQNLKRRGGHNKINYLLTESAFELFKNSFNLRNKYLVDINDNVKQVNSIGMCIENQTIGFIENSYRNILNVKRQCYFGKYRVDLYFVDYKLVIECDENNHSDRDQIQEKIREKYIISLGNKIIRFNPNDASFDLSNVLREINSILFYKN